MLGANINTVGWPACREIDIMEQKGWDKNTISAALHNLSSSGNTENTKETSVTGSTTGFHVYAVNWTAEKIEFSIDGMVFYTYNPTVKTNENWPYKCISVYNTKPRYGWQFRRMIFLLTLQKVKWR